MPRRATTELTLHQRRVLDWIRSFITRNGMPPTVREIGRQFDIQSSSVFDLLKALERKGALRRGDLGPRSLILKERIAKRSLDWVEVPIVGRIAAGVPILAVEDASETLVVDGRLGRGRDLYALRVAGDSMKDADILDGDLVIIRKQNTADDGDIVVALIEDEATLKRFYHEAGGARLQPANRDMAPIHVRSGEFRIQGKVVGVQRHFDRVPNRPD